MGKTKIARKNGSLVQKNNPSYSDVSCSDNKPSAAELGEAFLTRTSRGSYGSTSTFSNAYLPVLPYNADATIYSPVFFSRANVCDALHA